MDWKRLEALKRASVGQLLLKCARLLDEQAVARVNAEGGLRTQLRPAHTRLFPYIAQEGTRPSDIAKQLGITKQAVQQLVDDLVDLQVVEVGPDPVDGRARLVRFTSQGQVAIAHGLGVLADLEEELARDVGKARMKELGSILTDLLEALERRRG
jgi:DNA-binding MarR family transcriptional regulator